LSRYQQQLEKIIESGELRIVPESRKNEVLEFIRGGLEDISISRSRERTKGWGIAVPDDPTQTIYVWFDALSNYITALGYAEGDERFQKYWAKGDEIIHVIGKGITRFHAVYWPAMLLSAKLRLPSIIFVHGYLSIHGTKMSKTIGNAVNPLEVIKKYGVDPLRYFLLREYSPVDDGDYSEQKLIARYNADLANGLGNLVARVTALAAKHGVWKLVIGEDVEEDVGAKITAIRARVRAATEAFRFHEALAAVWELVAYGDKYVNDRKPWAEKDNRKTIANGIVIIDNIAALLIPFLPLTAERITKSIVWKSCNTLEIQKGAVLFPRR
jgi:methionyl-tRNA synthetase